MNTEFIEGNKFTQDDVNVRLLVKVSYVVEAGLHAGPLTNEVIAGLIENMGHDLVHCIEEVRIMSVHLDDGRTLIEGAA